MTVHLGHAVRTKTDDLAEAFAVGAHLGQLDHGLSVAEAQREADVGLGDGAHLEELHRAGDGRAEGDRVHALLVADEVGLDDGADVVDTAGSAVGPTGLVLGTLAEAVQVAAAFDLGHATAGDRATEAALVLDEMGLDQTLAGRVVGLVPVGAITAVVQRQTADLVDDVHENLGAQSGQAFAGDGMCAQHAAGLGGFLHELLRIGDLDATRAADDDGLEVLRTHDGAHAATASSAVLVVHDAGIQHHALARAADGSHVDLAVLGFESIGHGVHALAPQVIRGQELNELVVDVQVDRRFSLALEDDAVVAGILELGAEVTAGVGGADDAREWRLRDDLVTTSRACGGAGERAGHEDELVLRGQGVDLRVNFVAVVLGAQTTRADVVLRVLHVERFFLDSAFGQVDAKDCSDPAVSACHYAHTSSTAALSLSAASFFLSGTSSGSTTEIAPVGQWTAHHVSPSHRSHLKIFFLATEYEMLPSGHALTHILQTMHLLASCVTTPSALRLSAPVGQIAAQLASSHCMHMMGTVMAASS